MAKRKTKMIVFVTTFILFFIEAILHYNIGRREDKFVWPSKKELLEIALTVGGFSFVNSFIVDFLERKFSK